MTLKRNENISKMDEVTYGQLLVVKYLRISSDLREEKAFVIFFGFTQLQYFGFQV